jgi:hypothetical protein
MSTWKKILDGIGEFADGYLAGAAEVGRVAERLGCLRKRGQVQSLCEGLGWQVDEDGDGSLSVTFRDALGRPRLVSIGEMENSAILFIASSQSRLPASDVPPSVISHLMMRNHEVLTKGAWAVCVKADGDSVMYFRNCVFGDGLTSQRLKQICETMVGEVCAFDRKLEQAGLLACG